MRISTRWHFAINSYRSNRDLGVPVVPCLRRAWDILQTGKIGRELRDHLERRWARK